MIRQMIYGFCMALADSVPGVSGGTIAFLLGFYDEFIGALNTLLTGKKEEKIGALKFLIKLGIGWVIGFILAVLALTKLFDSHIYFVSSLFIGFIICSIPIIMKEEGLNVQTTIRHIIPLLCGIAVVIGITVLNDTAGLHHSDVANLSAATAVYILVAGMIAISAMILPGISGSSLLLIMGLYLPIIGGIKKCLGMDLSSLPMLVIFAVGVLLGIVTTVRLVKKALENHRTTTLYVVIGLMLGSLYAICRGAESLEVPKPAMTISTFNWLGFVVGIAIIFVLQKMKDVKEKNM